MPLLMTPSCVFGQADAIIEKIGYPDYQFNETVIQEFYKDVSWERDDNIGAYSAVRVV